MRDVLLSNMIWHFETTLEDFIRSDFFFTHSRMLVELLNIKNVCEILPAFWRRQFAFVHAYLKESRSGY